MNPARAFLAFFAFFLFEKIAFAQPSRDWDSTLGGSGWDELHLVKTLPNGHFLLGGNAVAGGGDVAGPMFGSADFWIVEVDEKGQKVWEKNFGGSAEDKLWGIEPLAGGGFLVAGSSASPSDGNKMSEHFGDQDFWVFKIDASGQKIWEKTYGGTGEDQLAHLLKIDENAFLLVGYSDSPADGSKTTAAKGGRDGWIVKIDGSGEVLWQKSLGGAGLDNFYSAVLLDDGGFLIGGASDSEPSQDSDLQETGRGMVDYWAVRLDPAGDLVWEKRFGGSERDQMQQVLALSDGNFLLVGGSHSEKGGDRASEFYGSFDFWMLKIDRTGHQIWQKSLGGSGFDVAFRALETFDGKIAVAGTSDSPISGNKTTNHFGNYDFWLALLEPDGEKIWDKTYGGTGIDALTDLVQSPEDGSLLLCGHSMSFKSAFKTEDPVGLNDFWLLKTHCGIEGDLPTELTFCQQNLLELDPEIAGCAGGACEIEWSNGASEAVIELFPDSSETVSVVVFDRNSCIWRDSVRLDILPSPVFVLGPDTSIFVGDTYFLDISQVFAPDLQWSTGSTSPSITASESGSYAVTATASNGCTATDEVAVCVCKERLVFIPNIFSPDQNLVNDRFFAFADPAAVTEIVSMTIFDRFGTPIYNEEKFPPNDPFFGWDGTRRGRRQQPGVFLYDFRILFSNGEEKTFVGTVTLVR